ncbi:MAG TPA: GntR family transcriptional regulator [Hyphomonadaceae bacterium]|jgi:GntR family transcriptional regulator|nr:GntR family transcriptional regulator [Hyphomonadaceae bacterium]
MTASAVAPWNDGQPIYKQIMETVIGRILEGAYPEGELLPSVRQLAVDFDVSPLTAAKVITELSRENITEKKRGIGFEVRKGVRKVLLHRERKRFMDEEWPEIRARMRRMGIEVRDLPRD